MNTGQMVAEGVVSTVTLVKRFLPGFTEENRTKQAPGLPNHLAWNLGHLALTMHRVADRIDAKGIPDGAFIAGSDRGDRERFGVESVGFNSTPTDDPSRYPALARCVAIFEQAADRFGAALRDADEATLNRMMPFGPTHIPAWQMGMRMIFHNGTHCGQIIDLRRALKLGNVLG